MTISMYQASVPVFLKMLANLKAILVKAAAHAEEKKIDASVFLDARLYPDMFPFTRQIQLACDFACGTAARLVGKEPPVFDDSVKGFAELAARVDRSVDYLRTLDAAVIDGSDERHIVRQIRGQPKTFTGSKYLLQFALPNFFFHATTAYAILRHNGVEVGKTDFIGALD
jgi:uncharacterized protein